MNSSRSAFPVNACVIKLNNDHPVVPLDYGYYVSGPVLTLFIVLGLMGNLFCLIIFLKKRPIPIVNFYTVPLCLGDCAVLVGCFVVTNLPHLLYGRMVSFGPYVRVYPSANYFSNLSYTFSIWLTVLLSIERYFALCHPLTHRLYDAKRRSLLISIICLIAAALYNIPRYFEVETFPCYVYETRELTLLIQTSELRSSQAFWISYKLILDFLLFSVGPLILLSVLTIRIRAVLRRTELAFRDGGGHHETIIETTTTTGSNKYSSSNEQFLVLFEKKEPTTTSSLASSLASSKEHKRSIRNIISIPTHGNNNRADVIKSTRDKQKQILTRTMFCVVLKFMLCHLLPAVINLCETVMDREKFEQVLMDHIISTSTVLIAMNSAANVFVFAGCNREFRGRVKKVFRAMVGCRHFCRK